MSTPRARSPLAGDFSRGLSLQEPADPHLYLVVSWLKRLVLLGRSLRLMRVALGAGADKAIYMGEGESLPYLGNLHKSIRPLKMDPIAVARLPSEVMRRRGESLLYLEVNRLLSGMVPPGGFLTLPWIRQKIQLEGPDYQRCIRSIDGVYGRKVRRYGLHCQLVQDRGALEEFYREFYCPYILCRFGRAAHLRSFHELGTAMRSGFLLKVLQGSQWISGLVCRRHKAEVLAFAFGLRGDYADLLRRGALSATYYFLIRWALEHSIEVVDLLRSRPHREDGVFVHKRRFGATPSLDSWPHSGIWVFPPRTIHLAAEVRGLLVWRNGKAVPLDAACILDRERQL